MKTLAIANHKGGVGKSATCHAIGESLAGDYKVLMVDMDPQGTLTQAVGIRDAAGRSMAEVLTGKLDLQSIIQPVNKHLSIAPSDIALAAAEMAIYTRFSRENILRNDLQGVDYDLVIIDCPPSLGLLAINALAASDAVLIPTAPQVVDLRGLVLFLETLDTIRKEINPQLQTFGVLVTFYDTRIKHHAEAIQVMNDADIPLLPVNIGRSIRVSEAAGEGKSVVTYAPDNPRAKEYLLLAEELKQWL